LSAIDNVIEVDPGDFAVGLLVRQVVLIFDVAADDLLPTSIDDNALRKLVL
jgi:hypothetical protein